MPTAKKAKEKEVGVRKEYQECKRKEKHFKDDETDGERMSRHISYVLLKRTILRERHLKKIVATISKFKDRPMFLCSFVHEKKCYDYHMLFGKYSNHELITSYAHITMLYMFVASFITYQRCDFVSRFIVEKKLNYFLKIENLI